MIILSSEEEEVLYYTFFVLWFLMGEVLQGFTPGAIFNAWEEQDREKPILPKPL